MELYVERDLKSRIVRSWVNVNADAFTPDVARQAVRLVFGRVVTATVRFNDRGYKVYASGLVKPITGGITMEQRRLVCDKWIKVGKAQRPYRQTVVVRWKGELTPETAKKVLTAAFGTPFGGQVRDVAAGRGYLISGTGEVHELKIGEERA